MPELWRVLVAVVVAFILSGIWYAVFGSRLAALHEAYAQPRSRAATAAVELVRNLVLALVTAGLVDRVGVSGVAGGLLLGLVLWVGFPAVILSGSVFHERVPPQLAAIHAGDWLLKLLAVTVIVTAGQ
jgi:hypothetical protein